MRGALLIVSRNSVSTRLFCDAAISAFAGLKRIYCGYLDDGCSNYGRTHPSAHELTRTLSGRSEGGCMGL